MQDAFRVRVIERIGDFGAVSHHDFGGQGGTAHEGRERLALDELHGDPCLAPLFADVIDGADVGVLELGGRPRFAEGVRGRLDELERHVAIQPGVARAIDGAHAAFAESGDDLVRS